MMHPLKGKHFLTEDNWTKEELDIVFQNFIRTERKIL